MFGWLRRWFGGSSPTIDPDPASIPIAYCEAVRRLKSQAAAEKAVEKEAKKGDDEPPVIVFLNPLAALLAAVERNKGKALTEREVLAVRNEALCLIVPAERARAYHATLDARHAIPRIDPDRCWSQWQKLRKDLDRFLIED